MVNKRRSIVVALLLPPLVMSVLIGVASTPKASIALRASAFLPLLVGLLAGVLSLAIYQEWSVSTTPIKKARVILGILATHVMVLATFVPVEAPVRLTAAGLALAVLSWSQAPRLRQSES